MSNVIVIDCPFEMKSTFNSLWAGKVLMHELQSISALFTQLLHSNQSFSFSNLSSWVPFLSVARKSSIICEVASKFWSSTNEQNVLSSEQETLSFLQVQSVKQVRRIVAVKIILRVIVVFLNGC